MVIHVRLTCTSLSYEALVRVHDTPSRSVFGSIRVGGGGGALPGGGGYPRSYLIAPTKAEFPFESASL